MELMPAPPALNSYGSGTFVHRPSGQIGQLTPPWFLTVSPLRTPVPVAVKVSLKKYLPPPVPSPLLMLDGV